MTQELYWLTLTALMTALLWVPYVLNRMLEDGVIGAMMNPEPDAAPKAQWAIRMISAHQNAVENLVVFGALILTVQLSNTATTLTAMAAMVYFFARLAHFVIYTLGIPGLRTVAFLAGFGCQMVLGLTVIGIL